MRSQEMTDEELVKIEQLRVHFPFSRGFGFWKKHYTVRALRGVDLSINKGETLGVVGESGCGKTTLGRAVLSLIPKTSGKVYFAGKDVDALLAQSPLDLKQKMQIVFQNPYGALNPRMTVGNFIEEPLRQFFKLSKIETQERLNELFSNVGLNPDFANRYPHEFSGGQRQRIVIARALAAKPQFIVADEPVSALDVSIQAQILNLLAQLGKKYNLTMMFIAHDLMTVRYICDRIAVMYLGKVVELASTDELFSQPKHPYTQLLLQSVPHPYPIESNGVKVESIVGEVPSPIFEEGGKEPHNFQGCSFYSRCPKRFDRCLAEEPLLRGDKRQKACHLDESA